MLRDLDRVKTEASSADSVVELGSEPLIGYNHTEVRKSRGVAFVQEDCIASLNL